MLSPYDEGYNCALSGYNRGDNPYEVDSEDYLEWVIGFQDGESYLDEQEY